MGSKYLEFIQKFLGESPVMFPEFTNIVPSVRPDLSIRAIIFDVYGTIMISASGDIEESEISVRNLEQSLGAAGIRIKITNHERQELMFEMLQSFRSEIIMVHETERSADNPYPEIDILSIWEKILAKQSKYLQIMDPHCIKCFIFAFETLSNNIYPMPGMKDVINQLSSRNIPLGIISNAQFYTPVILNYFLNGTISENENVPPFDPEITIYSYRHRRAKPDPYLFGMATRRCREKFGITPEQVLFIGNDMFRDIYPAKREGYKAALFAGDNRSLRLREEKEELSHISPDYVLTDLNQLLKIIV
jgi:putative hydrolase of the HAD superfamily